MAMKKCKECGEEISSSAKECPKCGKDQRNFFAKHKFITFILVIVILCSIGGAMEDNSTTPTNSNQYTKNTKVEVSIIDFSTMTKDEIQTWFDNNKINGTITEDYSNTIEKGNFISQSIPAGTTAHEGDEISIVYSLGKQPSMEELNALAKAESYSKTMHMSKKGIYKQLTSDYGEGFTQEAAQYAIDNLQVDYKINALEKAKSYQTTMHMSKKSIYDQLVSDYGEGFTAEEAQYAIDNLPN